MRAVVVTGYVEIPAHPRGREEYERLGARLADLRAAPVSLARCALDECWLDVHARGVGVRAADGGDPAKNSLAYHSVQHQKTAWLAEAAEAYPWAEVVVWVDYGIFHQPGVTAEVLDAFLRRVRPDEEVAIPGAWERADVAASVSASAEYPDWRFLGSSLVVARQLAEPFHDAVRAVTLERLSRDRLVTWEVNDWAEVERRGTVPIRWYQADHDHTQFTSYPDA